MKKRLLIILAGMMIVAGCSGCGEKKENADKSETGTEKAGTEDSDKKQEKKEITFKIAGEDYEFPMSYEKFKSYGWTYYKPEDDDVSQWITTLQPGSSLAGMFYNKDDIKALEFIFYNNTEEEVTLDKCQVAGFTVEYAQTIQGEDSEKYMKIPNGSIVINEKASIGEATKKDVYDYLGANSMQEGSQTTDYENYDVALYYLDESQRADRCLIITFDENDVFYKMSYLNVE